MASIRLTMFYGDGGGFGDGAQFSEVAPVTNPPPPGNWGPPQPQYGQGQPHYGPGQYPPQQPGWGPPPAPKNNGLKWLLIGVAVLLVIAISVGATLLFTRDSGNGTTQTANGNTPAAGDIASANDTGPINIITEDPTCAAWRPIASTLSKQESQGWQNRDISVPASDWSAEELTIHESVADAMLSAAEQTIPLVNKTPHRAMRELYEQSIAYWRLYADSIPQYTEADNSFAVAGTNASSAIVSICGSIEYGSADARAALVTAGQPPSNLPPIGDVSNPDIFLTEWEQEACTTWNTASDKFDSSIAEWQQFDGNIPASDWTPSQRDLMNTTAEKMQRYSEQLSEIGSSSSNPSFRDFAELAAIYWSAYSKSLPSHTAADNYLSATAAYVVYMVYHACEAVR